MECFSHFDFNVLKLFGVIKKPLRKSNKIMHCALLASVKIFITVLKLFTNVTNLLETLLYTKNKTIPRTVTSLVF